MKKFNSNWDIFRTVFIWLTIIVIIGLYENGIGEYFIFGIMIYFTMIVITLHQHYYTFLQINIKNKVLHNRNDWKPFDHKYIKINNIKAIERHATNHVRAWGSSIILKTIDDKGKEKIVNIYESNYNTDTIKAFLKTLKDINPWIEFDQQY